jgi:PAS domain S-box-containing protein
LICTMSMRSDRGQNLRAWRDQAAVLQGIAGRAPLHQVLDDIVLVIESEGHGLSCEICVIDLALGIVTESAGPNLPEIIRLPIGASIEEFARGPCASAAGKGETIIVEDIERDERWLGSRWRDNCLVHGLRSCQCKPIIDFEGRVVGAFTIYHHLPAAPPPSETVARMATVLASIAIGQDRNTSMSREKEEQFQLAVECADIGTWEWNCSKDEFVWSERCQQMFGAAKTAKVTLRRFLETIHSDDRERIALTLQESLRHHTTFKTELRCIWPDGSVHSIVATGREARSREASEPGLIHGVAVDVTDRKQAELATAESIARFRRLADALPEKIFTATPDGETDYLNQQWVTYTGLPLHEVLRLGWREFVHPDDLEEKVNRWKQAFKTGTPFEFEHRFRRADGVYRWHLSRAQPMRRSDGTISMWVGSNTDVDDLKHAQFDLRESEGRGRLAMEAAGLGFWDWTIGNTVKWSPEHNRMLGIPSEIHEGSYDLFISYIHASDRNAVHTALHRATEQRLDFEGEFRSSGIEGKVRWLSGHGRAYYDEQTGRPVRMIGVIRDITERKRFEEQLRTHEQQLQSALAAAELAREQAEAAGRAKDQFLAVLSHELRTPLTPVLMAVSAISLEKGLSDDVLDALDMIQRNIKVEARLIEDLLDLTRITRNKVELHLEQLDVHLALEQALKTCRPEIEAKNLRLRLQLSARKSVVVGDFARLQQVFWNLIKNAIKFTAEGGEILIQSYDKDGQIVVEISDTGVGIVPELLTRIFNPFEQRESEAVRQFGGLGLGLALSKATVDAHHGSLIARSEGKDRGATFALRLATVR